MTYAIFADPEEGQPPLPMFIKVRCDGSHGLFEPPSAVFPIDREPHPRSAPVRAGWKFTEDSVVFCPECR